MSDLCPVAASVNAMNLEDQPKTIGVSLLSLLKSKKFCNVIFTFPNRPDRIPAHKFCLKARSPVFEQIFRIRRCGNVEGNEIEISDSTPERFQQFLEFIYSDNFEVDTAGALELLQLSLKYKVEPLTHKCEELLQTEIPIAESVKVFETARHYGRRELMDQAGQIMVKSFLELVRTDALANAEEETLVYLLECRDLAVQQAGWFQLILENLGLKSIVGALDLLKLSEKYKIHHLTVKCEEFLETEIPVADSVKIFEAAHRHGRQELMDRAGPIMVKSFLELVGTGALANAREETLIYLLECDDLAVKEVKLFQFILDWGRHKVGASADNELMRNQLKNLILKIRFTNMTADEFAKVVVPKGLLSAEEIITVYTYFCVDEATKKDLKIEFNTTPRKVEARSRAALKKPLDFYVGQERSYKWFPAFSKHCISFSADRVQVDGKVLPDYFLKKTVITAVTLWTPSVNGYYKGSVVNMNVSIGESSGSVNERNVTRSFQKKLLNCKQNHQIKLSVEPPVELVSGRTYSVIVEDQSTADLMGGFRKSRTACQVLRFPSVNQTGNVYFENLSLTLKDIHRKTDFYEQEACDGSKELALIESIEIGLV